MSDLQFVEPTRPEWARMWEALRIADGLPEDDYEAWNETCGEAWQYMGTFNGAHEFRHRCHPHHGGQRRYLRIPASAKAA